jgi:hypothetical protein
MVLYPCLDPTAFVLLKPNDRLYFIHSCAFKDRKTVGSSHGYRITVELH